MSDKQLEKTLKIYDDLVKSGAITQEQADRGIDNIYKNESGITIDDDGTVHVPKDHPYNKVAKKRKRMDKAVKDYKKGKLSEKEFEDEIQKIIDIEPVHQVELTPEEHLVQADRNIESALHAYQGGYITEIEYLENVALNLDSLLNTLENLEYSNTGSGSIPQYGIGGGTDEDNERTEQFLNHYYNGNANGLQLLTEDSSTMTVQEAVYKKYLEVLEFNIDGIDELIESSANSELEFAPLVDKIPENLGKIKINGKLYDIYVPRYKDGANSNFIDDGWVTIETTGNIAVSDTNWGLVIAGMEAEGLEEGFEALAGVKATQGYFAMSIFSTLTDSYRKNTTTTYISVTIQEKGNESRAVIQFGSTDIIAQDRAGKPFSLSDSKSFANPITGIA